MVPATGSPSILLPTSISAANSLEKNRKTSVCLERSLVALVLLLAILISLFPVHNTDFWLHLATGRALATGKAGPATEPFSYTAQSYWVNHSWLFDLLLYLGFRSLGGEALVVLKALLVAVLAALMLRMHRRGEGFLIPALCTALALVAMSWRFTLQPPVISYVFLGLTFFILLLPEWNGHQSQRWWWGLPPLFALWVNLDAWFFVGPMVVGLFLAGAIVQRQQTWRVLGLVFLLGLIACLLNPFHVYAFRLPSELTDTSLIAALQRDDLLRRRLTTPWQGEYLRVEGSTIAGLAYYPLVALGLVSFLLNMAKWHWDRILVWVGFFGLSASYSGAIPFFAVVAGPIAALNLQEFAAGRSSYEFRILNFEFRISNLVRVTSVVGLLALIVLAWPGWLHGFHQEGRRVGLTVAIDPSMVRTAEILQKWRAEHKLTGNGLNLSPEAAHLMAWVTLPEAGRENPGKDHFFDARLSLYSPETAREYVRLRQAMGGTGSKKPRLEGGEEGIGGIRKTLQERGITYLIVYDLDPNRVGLMVHQALLRPSQMVLLHLEGHAAIVGLLDTLPPPPPGGRGPVPNRFADMAFNPGPLVFGAATQPLPPDPPHAVQRQTWWQRYLKGPGPRPLAADEAVVNLFYFVGATDRWNREHHLLPLEAASASALVALGPGYPLWARLALGPGLKNLPLLLEGPPAPVLLAARQGREALLRNPNHASIYFRLGQTYHSLHMETGEQRWGAAFPQLSLLRQAQVAASCRHAVLLKSDPNVHAALADLYSRLKYRDLALEHLAELVRARRQADPRREASEEESDTVVHDRLEALENEYRNLDKEIKNLKNEYALKCTKAGGTTALEKAQIALSLGLAGTALEVLLTSKVVEFGLDGARLELFLLLSTGRIEDLRTQVAEEEGVSRDLQENLGGRLYETYRFLLAGAEGNYAEADHFLEEAETKSRKQQDQIRKQLLMGIGQVLCHPPQAGPTCISAEIRRRLEREQLLGQLRNPFGFQPQADFRGMPGLWAINLPLQPEDYLTLRGILALEAGQPEKARQYFRRALVRPGSPVPFQDFYGQPAAAGYLELLDKGAGG